MCTQKCMCTQIKGVWYILMLDPIICKQTHVYPLRKFMCTQNIIQPISPIFLQMLATSGHSL